MNAEISIVLPTKNEEGHIVAFCEEILIAFSMVHSIEIIVIDASDDSTWDQLQSLSSRCSEINIFKQKSTGFSGALGEGLSVASGQWILCMNSDGNHRIEDAVSIYQQRQPNTFLIGSRFVSGGMTTESYIRYLISFVASTSVGWIAKSRVRENFSSFFLLPNKFLENCNAADFFSGKGEGMLRFICHLRQQRVAILETPVVYGQRKSGKSKTDLMSFLVEYIRCALELRPRKSNAILFRLIQFFPILILFILYQRNSEIFYHLQQNGHLLLIGLLGFTISIYFRALRMKSITKRWQHQVSKNNLLWDIISARYWNEIVPLRLGEIARIKRMNQREKIPVQDSVGMIVWEKLIGISTGFLGLLFLVTIAIGLPIKYQNPQILLLAVFGTLSFTLLFWLGITTIFKYVSSFFTTKVRLDTLLSETKELRLSLIAPKWDIQVPIGKIFDKGLSWLPKKSIVSELTSPTHLLQVIASSIGLWGSIAAVLIILARMIDIQLYASALAAIAFAVGVTTQVRLLPGAIGQVEVTQVLLLSYFGIAIEQSLLLASLYVVLLRSTNIFLGVIGVFLGNKGRNNPHNLRASQ